LQIRISHLVGVLQLKMKVWDQQPKYFAEFHRPYHIIQIVIASPKLRAFVRSGKGENEEIALLRLRVATATNIRNRQIFDVIRLLRRSYDGPRC